MYDLNQNALIEAYKQGDRFFIRIECGLGANVFFADILVDPDGANAYELAIRWLEKHDAKSVATYRILPDGKKNFIRIYDYRDLEEVA